MHTEENGEIEMPTKTEAKTDPMADYQRASEAIDQWQAELTAAREQIAAMEAAPVTDPASAKKQAGQLATAREYSYRCARALDDAVDVRDAAARADVEREAADLQPEIDEARYVLAAHSIAGRDHVGQRRFRAATPTRSKQVHSADIHPYSRISEIE